MTEGGTLLPLAGKIAVITGVSGDIGRATARLLASRGARIAAIDRNAPRGLPEELGDGLLTAIEADVTVEAEVIDFVSNIMKLAGRIDILFNAAGIEGCIAPVTEYPLEAFERVMTVNVTGTFLPMKYIIPHMAAQGGGTIINASSTAGLAGAPGLSAYVASKHAVIGLTRSAAAEWAIQGIRINCVNPGPIDGRMMTWIERGLAGDGSNSAGDAVAARTPAGRYGRPDEVAAMVGFLASDEATYVNGACMAVDGGRSAT